MILAPLRAAPDSGNTSLENAQQLLTSYPVALGLGPKAREAWLKRAAGSIKVDGSSVLGADLRNKMTKVKSLGLLENTFSNCLKDQSIAQFLGNQVINAAKNADERAFLCTRDQAELLNLLEKMENGFKPVLNPDLQKDFWDLTLSQAFRDTVNTLAHLEHQFGAGIPQGSKKNLEQACRGIEVDRLPLCRHEIDMLISNHYSSSLEEIKKKKLKTYSLEESAQSLNQKLAVLNEKLMELEKQEITVDPGRLEFSFLSTSGPAMSDKGVQLLKDYESRFAAVASDGPGILLLTQVLQGKTGGIRRVDKDLKKNVGQVNGVRKITFSFQKHSPVSEKDISAASKEAHSRIMDQITNLYRLHARWKKIQSFPAGAPQGTNMKLELETLVHAHPAAVGQVLIQAPYLAPLACEVINSSATRSQKVREKGQDIKTLAFGATIVGGAVILSGGVVLLGGLAVHAGTGMLVAGGMIAGAAGTAEAFVTAKDVLVHQQEFKRLQYQALENLRSTEGNQPEEVILQVQKALSDFEASFHEVLLNGAFSLAGFAMGSTTALLRGYQISGPLLRKSSVLRNSFVDSLSRLKLMWQRILKNKSLIKLIEGLETQGLKKDEINSFFGFIVRASSEKLEKLWKRMEEWSSLSPHGTQKLKDLVQRVNTTLRRERCVI